MGETLISTARLDRIESIDGNLVRVQAGVTLGELDEVLAGKGLYYPPIPTYDGAFVGGRIGPLAVYPGHRFTFWLTTYGLR